MASEQVTQLSNQLDADKAAHAQAAQEKTTVDTEHAQAQQQVSAAKQALAAAESAANEVATKVTAAETHLNSLAAKALATKQSLINQLHAELPEPVSPVQPAAVQSTAPAA